MSNRKGAGLSERERAGGRFTTAAGHELADAATLGTGRRQSTLKGPIQCSGIGLHNGRPVTMALFPAPVGHGIQFRRTDIIDAEPTIPALWSHVVKTAHCTTIANEQGVGVSTIEHLMAAVAGLGIDNLLITLDGPEAPIMDGSAAPFVFLMECAGIVEQDAPRRAIRVERRVRVEDGSRFVELSPAPRQSFRCEIAFDDPLVARQVCQFQSSEGAFKAEIARARTFGFLHEVDGLRAAGLGLGGSLDNAILVDDGRVLNDGGLRFDDEFVRHKVLDCLGDLALAGAPLIGHFHGVCSGHGLHNRLLRALFADPAAWSMVDDLPAPTMVAA